MERPTKRLHPVQIFQMPLKREGEAEEEFGGVERNVGIFCAEVGDVVVAGFEIDGTISKQVKAQAASGLVVAA